EAANCDFLQASQSWTLIVPSDGTKLKGASGTAAGQLGDTVYLTGNALNNVGPPRDGLQNWEVSNYHMPAGKVELIIVRRNYLGSLQPVPKTKIPHWEPKVNYCKGNSIGIVIRNPTAVVD